MGRTKKLEPLTETQQQISNIIYNRLGYMYCDNCRFGSEISEEEANEKYGYWGCEDCHRKYNGWGISKDVCDGLARKIGEIYE
jgi:hypothetical protein